MPLVAAVPDVDRISEVCSLANNPLRLLCILQKKSQGLASYSRLHCATDRKAMANATHDSNIDEFSPVRNRMHHCITFGARDGNEGYETTRHFQGLAADGSEIRILQVRNGEHGKDDSLRFRQKIWNISNGASLAAQGCEEPVVEVRQANWQAYSPSPLEEGRSSNRPCPVSFSSDLTHLRVGSQMLRLDENERYRAVSGMDATSGMELCDYFEEFAARGNFIAIARRRTLVQPVADVPNVAGSSKDYKTNDPANAGVQTKDNVPDSAENSADIPSSPKSPGSISEQGSVVGEDSSSDTEDYCCTSSEEESDHNSAYESWSEGSTDIDWNCQDDDIGLDDVEGGENERGSVTESSDDEDDDKSRTSHSSDSGSSRDEAVLSHGQLLDDYDGDGGVRFDFNDIRYPAHDYSSDEESHVGRFRATLPQGRKHSRTSPSQCSIAVYDSSSGSAVPLFRHSSRLTTELYESAPAFHPSRPLLVWPLCGGDILFADFQQKTYFVRNILPSARYSTYINPCLTYSKLTDCKLAMCPSNAASPDADNISILLRSKLSRDHNADIKRPPMEGQRCGLQHFQSSSLLTASRPAKQHGALRNSSTAARLLWESTPRSPCPPCLLP